MQRKITARNQPKFTTFRTTIICKNLLQTTTAHQSCRLMGGYIKRLSFQMAAVYRVLRYRSFNLFHDIADVFVRDTGAGG